MFVEERVDLRCLHFAEDERLPVELGPSVQVEHSNVSDVNTMRLSWRLVQVL